jgi:hypothetical protein
MGRSRVLTVPRPRCPFCRAVRDAPLPPGVTLACRRHGYARGPAAPGLVTPLVARTFGTGLSVLGVVTVLAGWGTGWVYAGAGMLIFGQLAVWRSQQG